MLCGAQLKHETLPTVSLPEFALANQDANSVVSAVNGMEKEGAAHVKRSPRNWPSCRWVSPRACVEVLKKYDWKAFGETTFLSQPTFTQSFLTRVLCAVFSPFKLLKSSRLHG